MSDSENESPQEEPKIIVDTDWKEQVAKEKEAAAQAEQDASPVTDQADTESVESPAAKSQAAKSPSASDEGSGDIPPPPPATFDVLISMLFTQAMSLLGQMPDPGSGEITTNKPYAKHYIDTLDMLSEKTKGNLSEDEAKILSEALHALRMMYVNAPGS